MQCVIESGGFLVTSATTPCPGFIVLSPAEADALLGQISVASLASVGITSESIATAFVTGFGWVATATAVAWIVGLALNLIRKV